jgi:hypothetical protein
MAIAIVMMDDVPVMIVLRGMVVVRDRITITAARVTQVIVTKQMQTGHVASTDLLNEPIVVIMKLLRDVRGPRVHRQILEMLLEEVNGQMINR